MSIDKVRRRVGIRVRPSDINASDARAAGVKGSGVDGAVVTLEGVEAHNERTTWKIVARMRVPLRLFRV
jgi:hypothetical protein